MRVSVLLMPLFIGMFIIPPVLADDSIADGMLGIKKGECYAIDKFGCRITAKLDQHTYELRCELVLDGLAMLQTKQAIFENTGQVIGVGVEDLGLKSVPLKNGFTGHATIFKECSVDFEHICHAQWRPPNMAIPIKTKECDKLEAKEAATAKKAVADNEAARAAAKKRTPAEIASAAKDYDQCTSVCAEAFSDTDQKQSAETCYAICEKKFN